MKNVQKKFAFFVLFEVFIIFAQQNKMCNYVNIQDKTDFG